MQTPQAALKISKYFLFNDFINFIKLHKVLLGLNEDVLSKCYKDCKFLAKDYQSAWSDVRLNYFKQWSQKPDNLLNFSIKEDENKNSLKK